MPSKRSPEKVAVGGYLPVKIRDALDKIARIRGLRSRTEALEALIRDEASRQKIKVPAPEPEYRPDALKKKK